MLTFSAATKMYFFHRVTYFSLMTLVTSDKEFSPFGNIRVTIFLNSMRHFAHDMTFFIFKCQGLHKTPYRFKAEKL